MRNSSAISCVAAAYRSGDKINTLKLATDCGMSRRWVQERIKMLKVATGLNQADRQSNDLVAVTEREPTMIRFRDTHGRALEVTRYAPMTADVTIYHGVVDSGTGDHYDA